MLKYGKMLELHFASLEVYLVIYLRYLLFVFYQKYKRGDGESHELFFNLLEHLLEYEPEKRLTAREAMSHPFFYGMSVPCFSSSRHSHSKSR